MAKSAYTDLIIARAEQLLEHIERSIDQSTARAAWRLSARSVLLYWLGKFFEEDAGRIRRMEETLAAQRQRTEELQHKFTQLLLRIKELETK